MSLERWHPSESDAFVGYRPAVARRLGALVDGVGRRLGVTFEGLERLPSGPALLVANHAFGYDVAFLMARVHAETGRRVWALGEHAWWKVPAVRRLAAAFGTVDGTPENADKLLAGGELVLVLPGGLRESMKPRELRYRLLWGRRYGFLRAAVRRGVPVVPVASLGADELIDLVGNPFARSKKLHLPFPLPRPSHLLPIPHRVRLKFVVGEPIPTAGIDVGDEAMLRRLRRETEGALHEIFEEELARRAGFAD